MGQESQYVLNNSVSRQSPHVQLLVQLGGPQTDPSTPPHLEFAAPAASPSLAVAGFPAHAGGRWANFGCSAPDVPRAWPAAAASSGPAGTRTAAAPTLPPSTGCFGDEICETLRLYEFLDVF